MIHTITVEVVDGLLEVYDVPKNVRVVVRDYDVEGVEEELLLKDSDGYPCLITEYP